MGVFLHTSFQSIPDTNRSRRNHICGTLPKCIITTCSSILCSIVLLTTLCTVLRGFFSCSEQSVCCGFHHFVLLVHVLSNSFYHIIVVYEKSKMSHLDRFVLFIPGMDKV